jgi:hypothetical protein
MQLHNRTILITGGGSGIGLELARGFSDISMGSEPVGGCGLVVSPSIRGRYTA